MHSLLAIAFLVFFSMFIRTNQNNIGEHMHPLTVPTNEQHFLDAYNHTAVSLKRFQFFVSSNAQ